MSFSGATSQISLYALIVAGGSGSRMQSDIPKQFLLLGNKPVLLHTIEAFHAINPSIQLVLVLPAAETGRWKEIRKEYDIKIPHAIVEGGNSRFQSVRQGLALVPPESLVAIHDGVRPFIQKEMLEQAYATAADKGAAITTVPLKESIRRMSEEGSKAENRSSFCLVQTPQVFQARLIKKAYRQEESRHFTDCASVAEAAGSKVYLVAGSYDNIKITSPEDMLLAESLLKRKKL
ncbi:2-C-methyl-D-erythritol 4-phosphate cytidylyltransferase [Nafulsella turpanensis]|uniref:2-C-methyl-D-erythritol 4-phosphate cytidylyltransferase n=1 Tax=Nafulsella turpanensis TaxID=1265690 RepID=UPI00034AE54C|nr:2-C-methyl-D-erythritol 4-phosphate cytidylyltransferase [Nafulsella turpanensis]